jgi:hypothetical protein
MRTAFALLAVLFLAACGGGDEPQEPAAPLAPIVIESPAEGETVTSPLRVSGTASVFEANVILRLVAEDGTVLFENFVTATEGAPGRGTFAREIAFTASGPATLVAFEPSAADGSELHKVEVPLLLRP